MAAIRLVRVTRKYLRNSILGTRTTTKLPGEQWDRAFAQRAAAHGSNPGEAAPAGDDGNEVLALDDANLTIPDGKTCAIVGPSGCGKSTLLRVVAGLDTDYQGDVLYDDQDVREIPVKDRYIGMVFQNYALYPHFPGHGNLSFFFQVHRAPDAVAEERIRATSEIMGFGFNQLLERKPGTLSGGQQQRLAIARALVRNPKLFLFDEPLSNLDAKLRAQTRVEIKRLLRRFSITAIYVTHDQEEAIALGDMIAVMRAGRIEQAGEHMELLRNPANAFVAGFLGSHPMNLLEGVVEPGGILRFAEASLPMPEPIAQNCQQGQKVLLGIRPEELKLVIDRHMAAQGVRLSGEVELIEPDFVRRVQYVRVDAGPGVFTVIDPSNTGMRMGESIEIELPAEALYFFDAESGERIRPA